MRARAPRGKFSEKPAPRLFSFFFSFHQSASSFILNHQSLFEIILLKFTTDGFFFFYHTCYQLKPLSTTTDPPTNREEL